MSISCRFIHRWTSTLQGVHIPVATHNCDILSRSGVHPLGYTLCIPPHKPLPFTPILDYSNLISLNAPSRYQSISTMVHPLNDYQHTFLHRLPWQSYPTPSSPHGRSTPSSILSFIPFFTLHNSLIRAFGILKFSKVN